MGAASSNTEEKWLKLAPYDGNNILNRNLIQINRYEFLRFNDRPSSDTKCISIQKYNINNNQWQQWLPNIKTKSSKVLCAGFDNDKQILYIYCLLDLIIINFGREITITHQETTGGDGAHTALPINGELHLFGHSHSKWYPSHNQFVFTSKIGVRANYEIIALKKRNKVLCLVMVDVKYTTLNGGNGSQRSIGKCQIYMDLVVFQLKMRIT